MPHLEPFTFVLTLALDILRQRERRVCVDWLPCALTNTHTHAYN